VNEVIEMSDEEENIVDSYNASGEEEYIAERVAILPSIDVLL